MHLFLDDERKPSDVTWVVLPSAIWTVVRNFDQFVEAVTKKFPDFVTFDHDLADTHYAVMQKEVAHYFNPDEHGGLNLTFDYGKEKTGYECAKWLVDYCDRNHFKFPPYQIHSMNPVGAKRIKDYIENAKKHLDI